jgi:SAM-dependent methyltransferase
MAVERPPDASAVSAAYADAVDEVTLREAEGQIATADAGLRLIEDQVRPGRILDVGCWTGSFLVAAERRGWDAVGVEPSDWAASEAKARGLDVHHAELDDADLAPESFDAVVSCDVLEHLADPGAALDQLIALLKPGGALYLTVPDAGSRFARTMGKRWWAIVPMHLQYYTRGSMRLLLVRHGLEVRHMGTHPKQFTVRYYAERAAGFVPVLGKAGLDVVGRTAVADRLVAPDFGDRMEVVAVKPGGPT